GVRLEGEEGGHVVGGQDPGGLRPAAQLGGVPAALVRAVRVDPDELEVGPAEDRVQRAAADVAGGPLDDAERWHARRLERVLFLVEVTQPRRRRYPVPDVMLAPWRSRNRTWSTCERAWRSPTRRSKPATARSARCWWTRTGPCSGPVATTTATA